MIPTLILALAVAAQADDDAPSLPMLPDDGSPAVASPAASEPGLHRLRVVGPRDCWVWSVRTADGRFRPVDYRPTTAPARPAFETNGVVAARLASDGRTIRASDSRTLAEVTAVAERCKPEPPADPAPGPPVEPGGVPPGELILYAAGVALCILGVLIAVRSALRPR